jgi:DNA-binding NarL/FixJ family response regulator
VRFRAMGERLRAYAPPDDIVTPDTATSTGGMERALEALSDREREVLVLVAQGLTNKEIAERLTISENTARNHVSRMLEKLRLARRSEAAAFAAQHGLLNSKPPRAGGA